ncbi:glycoside hydrolase family 15 protein [Methylobacterium sp. 092160098-2]|uniref:glycoside hydrolase family 15 protein n=1 Tax=Methylobacterium sp. 092160098-2 TaxID=3025129 RepID=UPI002381B702|nr:glycoside hydrolase family 15 protein [Methylobacterium sp. 092160098-2]MDE4915187.1 glycoside hydrolase family 15 protein [Methylobacterium sp. 092160098-2]
MPYADIEAHGIIGNLQTAALVCSDGTIDFFCYPRFDSPSVFAAMLDDIKGGRFSIKPKQDGVRTRQMYLPETNVLVTRFMSEAGMAEVIDYMPICNDGPKSALVRLVKGIRGSMTIHMECEPRFDYARATTHAHLDGDGVVQFSALGGSAPLRMRATVPMTTTASGSAATFTLAPGEEAGFVLECTQERPSEGDLGSFLVSTFSETIAYWRAWSGRSHYRGRWREIVQRSALALKVLTSAEHGAVLGAATFGLPEWVGGGRNWDYRYCWIRDAAFTVYALMRLGYTAEATAFIGWVEKRAREQGQGNQLQILYAIDGNRDASEEELSHLAGYRGSKPVRIGNAAAEQLQLDIYGELADAIYLADKYGVPASIDTWHGLSRALDWVCENWDQPDEGIWEVRGGRKAFLSGRLMCWVALNRGLRMARQFARPTPLQRWHETQDAIAHSIYTDFWNPEKRAFVQRPGCDVLDAAALLMPLVKFISPVDPRWLSTLDAIGRELVTDALVLRYQTTDGINSDGLEGKEGAFTPCSFWYVECLARAGRLEEAQLTFEKMLGYANHLGLYAEELGPRGEHLGNFPQAFTHLALISAAYALDRALSENGKPSSDAGA